MKKETRICDHCKRPMFNSWAGVHIGEYFIEVHMKCQKDYKPSQTTGSVRE